MQRERNEHRWQAVRGGRSTEPAVELWYPIHHGFLAPVAPGRALAEQIELSGHPIGVVPPGDDVDPVVLRRSRPPCRYGLPDHAGSESPVGVAERGPEVAAVWAWETEGDGVADDVASGREGRAHLEYVGDSRLRVRGQLHGLEPALANDRGQQAEEVHDAPGRT